MKRYARADATLVEDRIWGFQQPGHTYEDISARVRGVLAAPIKLPRYIDREADDADRELR